MIVNFRCKYTQKIWDGDFVKKFPRETQMVGRRKLRMLASTSKLEELLIPPSNCLKKLEGNKKDIYSIRINDQWRICFQWQSGNAYNVEIIDYH